MGCCSKVDEDDTDPNFNNVALSKAREYDQSFKGPISKRSCTDVICCIIFFLAIGGQIAVSYFAFKFGNPNALLYPTDSKGRYCGSGTQKGKPYLLFFDLVKCATKGPAVIALGCPTPQICVKECPKANFAWPQLSFEEETARATGMSIDIAKREKYLHCVDDVDITNPALKISDLVASDECAPYYVNSSQLLKRCVPAFIADLIKSDLNFTGPNAVLNHLVDKFNHSIPFANVTAAQKMLETFIMAAQQIQLVIDDIVSAWYLILVGILIGAILAFVWCVLMRWISGFIVYVTLLSFFLVFLAATVFCFYFYTTKTTSVSFKEYIFIGNFDKYKEIKETYLWLGIIAAILTFIILLILLCLRKRIVIAVAIIGESSRAVGAIMTSLLFPFFPFLFELVTIAFSSAVGVFLLSATRIHGNNGTFQNCNLSALSFDSVDDWKTNINSDTLSCALTAGSGWEHYLQAYNIFMFFWLLCFVIGFGQIVLAGAFASWYWSWEKPKDVPAFPILYSLGRTIRYHLGTVAFGTLIIAIVMFIRAILAFIQSKLKGKESKVAKFFLCCLQCCFWCLEKCLKFLTKNAFIVTSIYGLNFCRAAKDAFFLILRNCLRLAVLDGVTSFVLFIGKLLMTGLTGTLAFFFFNGTIPNLGIRSPELNYIYVPVVLIIIGTFVVASMFFNVYDFCVDTLFICVMEDLERNDGSPEKPYFMSKELMKIFDKKNKFHDDAEEREGGCGLCCCQRDVV